MQFTVAAFLALAGAAFAQDPTANFNPLTAPGMNEVIPAGKPFAIKWTPSGGNGAPVSLYAYAGKDARSLQEISTIASGVEASLGRFEWNIESSLGGKYQAYGIKIALASDKNVYQWSNPFTIAADPSAPSTSSSATVASSTGFTAKTDVATTSTSTKAASTTSSATISSSVVINAPIGNLSTTAVSNSSAPVTLVTSTSISRPTSTAGATTSAVRPIATGGAVAKGASSIAVLGGLAMAVLAL